MWYLLQINMDIKNVVSYIFHIFSNNWVQKSGLFVSSDLCVLSFTGVESQKGISNTCILYLHHVYVFEQQKYI